MVWVGRDLKDHLVPTSLPWARTRSARPDCSKLRLYLPLYDCDLQDWYKSENMPSV